MKHSVWTGVAVASLLVNIGLAVMATRGCDWKTPARQAYERKPVRVKVAAVKREPIAVRKNYPGLLKASKSVIISSDVAGRVAKVLVKTGEKVKKDQVLIQIDDAMARAELKALEAKAQHAKEAYATSESLRNVRSRLELAQRKAEMDIAQAELEKGRLNLARTQIKAPFDGEVGVIGIHEGGMLDPRQEVTRVVSCRPINVEFDVSEADAAFLKKGHKLLVSAPDLTALPETGVIEGIQPYSDASSHTVRVQAVVENAENIFRDGAYARVTVEVGSNSQALVVPREAVATEGSQHYVFMLSSDKGVQQVRKMSVILGMKEDTRVQIEETMRRGPNDGADIQEGCVLVSDPVDLMVDGLQVNPVTEGEEIGDDQSATSDNTP